MNAVYEGEEAPNGESISAAGYDANNGVVYGLEASGKLYRYSGFNSQGKLTGRTQVANRCRRRRHQRNGIQQCRRSALRNQRCSKPDDC